MALALLSSVYAREIGAEVIAFTVDHGLRAGAAEEAAQTARWCAALGLQHKTLRWTEDKPNSGVQAAARAARYRLLAGACEVMGLSALMTAHSQTDQAETVMMRLQRGAGVRGLSAMADETLIAAGPGAPVRLLRPLLPFSRSELTATVRAADQPFIDDPSNEDTAYERVRVRKLLSALEGEGEMEVARLADVANKMRAARRVLEDRERAFFKAVGGTFTTWGGARMTSAALAEHLDDPVTGAAMASLVQAVTGAQYRVDEEAAKSVLCQALERGAGVVGGALCKARRGEIFIIREPAAVLGREGVEPLAPTAAPSGEKTLFDRRFIIENTSDEELILTAAAEADRITLNSEFGGFDGPHDAVLGSPLLKATDGLVVAAGAYPSVKNPGIRIESLAEASFFNRPVARF